MHQQTHGPDVGDRVEVLGRKLHLEAMEYDGCEAEILNIFSDSKGTECATVKVISPVKGRAGKRYFPMAALKKL